MAASFSGGGSRRTRREPPTMAKQLVNFITCGCESSPPFTKHLNVHDSHQDTYLRHTIVEC